MKNKPTTNKPITNKPIKAAKNRITALLLAFLLTATILIPQISVKAQETTTESADISENNSSGGTSAGVGDNLPTDSFGEGYTRRISPVFTLLDKNDNVSSTYKYRIGFKGEGSLVIHSYHINPNEVGIVILSNKPMEYKMYQDIYSGSTEFLRTDVTENALVSQTGKNGIYYMRNLNLCLSKANISGLPNLHEFSGSTAYHNWLNQLLSTVDLSKDDYISDEDKADMTPVRDESIGYLPRARYFDNRNDSELSFDYYNDYDATIQWASFEEPYASDLDNPYYVEVYAQIHYKLGKASNESNVKMVQYKKYGELKYVAERLEFPHREPADNYLLSIGAHLWSKVEGLNPDSDMAIQERSIKYFYVRLVHYDYNKQQVLCGGWTRLKVNDDGGCTSEEGDFPPDNEDDWTPDDPDKDPDEWGDTGDEKDPNKPDPDNPDPDNPDLGIDTSSIGAFIVSVITSLLNAIKSILLLVGEFPDLCKHVFSFLPDEISTMMFLGTTAIVVMRFLGR